MALLKTKPSLTVVSTPKPSKKYLGEPGSPHYVPDSPLIDRQFVSLDDEDELIRICKIVLANVQSADEDDIDESFNYLASQIQDKHTANGFEDVSMSAAPAVVPGKVEVLKVVNDTSNDSGLRTTFGPALTSGPSAGTTSEQTVVSTPLASARVTPGEISQRSSGPKPGLLGLNRGSTGSQGSRAADLNNPEHAVAWVNNYLGKHLSRPETRCESKASESTLQPIQRTASRRSTSQHRIYDSDSNNNLSQIDFNKRLPAMPGQQAEVERPRPITRLMKSIRRKHASPTQTEEQPPLDMKSSSLGSDSSTEPLKQDVLRPDSSTSRLPMSSPSKTDLKASPSTSSYNSGRRRRLLLSTRFIGRFEWKRQKVPPVIQAV